MNCPRCTSPVFSKEDRGERFLACDICGYYHARIYDGEYDGNPIFREFLHEPLGVVVTPKGNFQYYNTEQRDRYLRADKSRGYTYFNGKEWKYIQNGKEQKIQSLLT